MEFKFDFWAGTHFSEKQNRIKAKFLFAAEGRR